MQPYSFTKKWYDRDWDFGPTTKYTGSSRSRSKERRIGNKKRRSKDKQQLCKDVEQ